MKDDQLLKELYSREESLFKQLSATQQAIIGFGGTPNTPHKIQLASMYGITDSTEFKTEKPEAAPIKATVKTRNSKSEVSGYIIEILQEHNKPINAITIAKDLKMLGFEYGTSAITKYLGFLLKDSKIIKIEFGKYAHLEFRHPIALKKVVKTIVEVSDYIKLRGEVTRKELMAHFVKGGRMNENMLQLRIENLINDDKAIRKERGVYAWKKGAYHKSHMKPTSTV